MKTASKSTVSPDSKKVVAALEDGKAEDVVSLNIADYNDFTDVMIIATGRSPRHLKALADNLFFRLKKQGHSPLMEGRDKADWILIDAGDLIVHLFQEESRKLYNLEKLWGAPVGDAAKNATKNAIKN